MTAAAAATPSAVQSAKSRTSRGDRSRVMLTDSRFRRRAAAVPAPVLEPSSEADVHPDRSRLVTSSITVVGPDVDAEPASARGDRRPRSLALGCDAHASLVEGTWVGARSPSRSRGHRSCWDHRGSRRRRRRLPPDLPLRAECQCRHPRPRACRAPPSRRCRSRSVSLRRGALAALAPRLILSEPRAGSSIAFPVLRRVPRRRRVGALVGGVHRDERAEPALDDARQRHTQPALREERDREQKRGRDEQRPRAGRVSPPGLHQTPSFSREVERRCGRRRRSRARPVRGPQGSQTAPAQHVRTVAGRAGLTPPQSTARSLRTSACRGW